MAVHFILLLLAELCIAPAIRVTHGILMYPFVPLLCKFLEKGLAFLVANLFLLDFHAITAHEAIIMESTYYILKIYSVLKSIVLKILLLILISKINLIATVQGALDYWSFCKY